MKIKISKEEFERLILKEKELSILKEAIAENMEYNQLTDDLTLLGSGVSEAFKVLYRDRYEEDLEWKKAVYEKGP